MILAEDLTTNSSEAIWSKKFPEKLNFPPFGTHKKPQPSSYTFEGSSGNSKAELLRQQLFIRKKHILCLLAYANISSKAG